MGPERAGSVARDLGPPAAPQEPRRGAAAARLPAPVTRLLEERAGLPRLPVPARRGVPVPLPLRAGICGAREGTASWLRPRPLSA